MTHESKKYDRAMMAEMLESYIKVPRELWDHIAPGSHIRFIKANAPGESLPEHERFKPGGIVNNHFQKEGVHYVFVHAFADKKVGFALAYPSIESMWKKYPSDVIIELNIIQASLAKKKEQITELETKMARLESIIAQLDARFRK